MGAFTIRRVWEAGLSLLLLSGVVFLLSRLLGDPITLMLPLDAAPDQIARIRQHYGLDRSLPEQYITYLANLLQGDLGMSIRHRAPVTTLFLQAFPATISLAIPALVAAGVIGVPLGVIASTTRSHTLKKAISFVTVAGMAVPPFWLGLVLILLFSVYLGLLPSGRSGGLAHVVLPVATLAFALTAGMVRLIRSSMLENLGADYVRLSRLEGFPEWRVIWIYTLRNSLISFVSFTGVYLALLVTGAVVVEKVFSWPGVGRLLFDGIVARDYPLVQGVILLSAGLIIAVTVIADLVHALLDPKVRLG